MTKIKMCGLSRNCDIDYANEVMPEFAGFVFAPKSRRYVSQEKVSELSEKLNPEIITVGVFVNENIEKIVRIVNSGIIKIPQLHGSEDNGYIDRLKALTGGKVIKAFKVRSPEDIENANKSHADYVLLDSGEGSGLVFDHSLISGIKRSYFLAGGLNPENVRNAVNTLKPYAVDASSGLETEGFKDLNKMKAFADAVRR